MKKNLFLITLIVLLTVLASCSPADVAVEKAVLSVGDNSYSQSELETLGTASADYTNKDGETTTYTGTPLADLLTDAGLTASGTLVFTAADGFEADMPLEDALACVNCIVAFDDGSLRMVMPDFSSKLQVKDVIEISLN